MKITAIKTLVCNAEMRNWVFVRVETDQSGLYGWGEATSGRPAEGADQALQHHRRPADLCLRALDLVGLA